MRLLSDMGYRCIAEFSLKNNRRADIIGLNKKGVIVIVEVKSSVADFRSDRKWKEYLDHCDEFYFAVTDDFPQDILPPDEGQIIADKYGAAIISTSQSRTVNATRRKTLVLNFARTAAQRLHDLTDPGA